MKNPKSKKPYSATKDISADLRKLKRLERKGIITIFQVEVETPTPKIKNIDLPIAVLDYTKLNGSLVASQTDDKRLTQIKGIIGKNNVGDAIHLYTHMREKRNYFVTEDKDILDKKAILMQKFRGLKIRTTNELVNELDN